MMNLLHGDCLERMKDIPKGSVDLVLCDPPYGITSRNKWDEIIPFEEMWECLHGVTKKNAAIVLFSKLPFASDLIQSNRKEFRYEWVWQKHGPVGFLNANRMPLCAHENLLVFYKKLPKYNPQFRTGKPYKARSGRKGSSNYGMFNTRYPTVSNDGKRYPIDVLKFDNSNNNKKIHPTQKPVSLLEYIIKTYTDPGETVLDFCMGSGSTGVACLNTGRNFIGIEKDDEYYQKASQWIERERTSGLPA